MTEDDVRHILSRSRCANRCADIGQRATRVGGVLICALLLAVAGAA